MVQQTSVDLTRFDFSTLPDTGFFEILGKRGTGKTTWTQYITQFSPHKDTGTFIVIVGSESVRRSWESLVAKAFVIDVDDGVNQLERIKRTQSKLQRDRDNQSDDNTSVLTPSHPAEHLTLIMDDVASNNEIMRSNALRYLASNSRHLNMCIFILAQYHVQIPSEVRAQFDIVFMLTTADKRNIERIHAEYCSCTDIRLFRAILTHATEDHGLLVIDNQTAHHDIVEMCAHASIDAYPPILARVGAPEQWNFTNEYFIDHKTTVPPVNTAERWQIQRLSTVHKEQHDKRGVIITRLL